MPVDALTLTLARKRRVGAAARLAAGALVAWAEEGASMGQWTPAGFDPAASATVGPGPVRGGVLGDARIASILPSKGHHQGNTSVSIFGSGFLFNSSEVRCCWDHHPGYLSSQIIKDGRVKGGDGVPDKETVPTLVSDTLLVCPSYVSIPGYTHTDDLLLSFGHTSCNGSQLLDTELDFQFYLNTLDMQVRAVEPRGGPVAGGTRVRFVGTNFGGHRMRCRFGWYEVDATYIDINHVMCNSPHVRQPHSAEVQVAPAVHEHTPIITPSLGTI